MKKKSCLKTYKKRSIRIVCSLLSNGGFKETVQMAAINKDPIKAAQV